MLCNTFGTEKPMIALLHMDPLPGDPLFGAESSMDQVVAHVRRDLENLIHGGVDAVLFSNEFSLPYQNKVSNTTVAAMAYVIGQVKDLLTIPFGVHVISDGMATIELAAAVGASFVRGIFTGAYVGECGLKETDIAAVLRRKNDLRLDDLRMFYMVNAEADAYLNDRDLKTIVNSLIFKCHPDGICLSGLHAGEQADDTFLDEMRAVAGENVAVFANTGCNASNVIEKMKHCDGAFVGTAFKQDGKFENYTDADRIKTFMDIVKAGR